MQAPRTSGRFVTRRWAFRHVEGGTCPRHGRRYRDGRRRQAVFPVAASLFPIRQEFLRARSPRALARCR
jgi:hypothetical protein